MVDLHHQIRVQAPAEAVYRALTTGEGLRGWWTADSAARPQVGSLAELGFDGRKTVFRMRVEALELGSRVVWSCLGEPEEWKGTRLTWDIQPDGEKTTAINFTHGGWKEMTPLAASCNTTWGSLLFRLKDYLEGKRPGPMWIA